MKKLLSLAFFILGFISCSNENNEVDPESSTALKTDTISSTKTPGKLVVLFENSISSYYINKGYPRGFEYEMLNYFCKESDLELEIKMVHNLDYMFDSLVEGSVDIIAANLSITGVRKEIMSFSAPILRTRQVLVQRIPKGYNKMSKSKKRAAIVTNALDLNQKTVHIHSNTTYKEQLELFKQSNGLDISIVEIDPKEGVDQLIHDVSEGKIDYTILDENIAFIYKKIYPNLHISTPASLSQNIAWAVKKDNKALVNQINNWQDKTKGGTRWNMIYNKYFKNQSKEISYMKSHIDQIKIGEISPYDELIKKHAQHIGWDWRLLASLIRKESRFNPNVESDFGAQGLMQVLPKTAERFGVSEPELKIPELNIMAGTRFIQWLENYWAKRLPDTIVAEPFILASYNVGMGHVLDAMKLAEKHGLNQFIWNDNVEVMLLNKSKPTYYKDPVVKHGYCRGGEPVNYVKDIYKFYEYYRAFTDNNQEEESIKNTNSSTASL